jgi:hypothetical protein
MQLHKIRSRAYTKSNNDREELDEFSQVISVSLFHVIDTNEVDLDDTENFEEMEMLNESTEW